MSQVTRPLRTRSTANPLEPEAQQSRFPFDSAGLPLMYEDEGMEEMGDADVHTRTGDILLHGVEFHLANHPSYQVFWNLNLYYSADDSEAYVSPDLMVIDPPEPLVHPNSYRVGPNGPVPILVMEVLSQRTYQQGDLREKPILYARLGVREYVLVDVTGQFLVQRLLLKRLRANGTWEDRQDADGGVTSQLGFRIILDADGQVRLLDAKTGKRYVRPREAQATADQLADQLSAAVKAQRKAERSARAAAKAQQVAEERIRVLEEELARLKSKGRKRKGS